MGKLAELDLSSLRRCKFGRLVDDLDDDDQAAVLRAVTGGASLPQLGTWLAGADLVVSTDIIGKHLRGVCRCDPDAALRSVRQ